jgi:phage terminase large subunit
MQSNSVTLEIIPRRPFREFLTSTSRFCCLVCHRRAGKTVATIQYLVMRAAQATLPNSRFAYIAPTYAQAKDVAWGYLVQFVQNIPDVDIRVSELAVYLPNGARIRLYGSDNYDRMRGLYFDGVIIDEAGDQDPRAWPEVIRPALTDRKGWAVFIGTPKGRNDFYRIYKNAQTDPEWYCLTLRASQSGLIAPSELASARSLMTPEQYEQEFECSFESAIKGAYWGDEIRKAEDEGRVKPFSYEPLSPAFAGWDLGIDDAMALAVGQQIGREIRWLAYYENVGKDLGHYVDWLDALPFKVPTLYTPHDSEVRELQTGISRTEFLEKRGYRVEVQPRRSTNCDEEIQQVRLRLPTMWFNSAGPNMERMLDVMRMYQSNYNDKLQTVNFQPLHNWASHGADAVQTAIQGLPVEVMKTSGPIIRPTARPV